jgi:hypothetical protein
MRLMDPAPLRFPVRSFRLWLHPLVGIAMRSSSGEANLPVPAINGEAPVCLSNTRPGPSRQFDQGIADRSPRHDAISGGAQAQQMVVNCADSSGR